MGGQTSVERVFNETYYFIYKIMTYLNANKYNVAVHSTIVPGIHYFVHFTFAHLQLINA